MKILFVLTYYRPHWTGLTQYAARLAEGLAQRGHEVAVLSSQHQKDLAQEETINKVKVFRLPSLFRISRTQITPLFPLKLFLLIRENEVVVAYLPLTEIILVAILAKIFKRKFFLVHNGDLVLPTGLINWLLEKIYYLTTGIAIRLANGVIVQTKDYSEKSRLLSPFKDKWRVILPLYEKMKISKTGIEKFKKKYHLGRKKLIGFSGRFVEEKGVDYLLEAIPKVMAEIPNAHFVFAGESQIAYEKFWERIKALVEKNRDYLLLLGLIKKKEEMANFYGSTDVLVQPSRSDCFPSSLVEAILAGIPVVCTNISGARWVVKKTKMGVLVPPRNHQALAKGIVRVLKNRKKYLQPRKKIEKIFNYEETIKKYEKLFKV